MLGHSPSISSDPLATESPRYHSWGSLVLGGLAQNYGNPSSSFVGQINGIVWRTGKRPEGVRDRKCIAPSKQ